MKLIKFFIDNKLVISHSQLRRIVFQGAVKHNGKIVNIKDMPNVDLQDGDTIQLGKREPIIIII